MALEIERKFLVSPDFNPVIGTRVDEIWQGYLSDDVSKTVRVRHVTVIEAHSYQPRVVEKGFLTIKGASEGMTRKEYEYEIPAVDASELLSMCDTVLLKHRWKVMDEYQQVWDVDVFKGAEFSGLVVAEIELPSEDTEVALPWWVMEEVTHDPYYYNSNLIKLVTKSNEISLPQE